MKTHIPGPNVSPYQHSWTYNFYSKCITEKNE